MRIVRKRIYLAAPYGYRHTLREDIAPALRALGHQITSEWIDEPRENDDLADYLRARRAGSVVEDKLSDMALEKIATRDYYDVQRSDVLIRFFGDPQWVSSGGKFVETGIAAALGLEVVVIGPRCCVFDYLPFVRVFETFEAYLATLAPSSEKAA